MDPLPTRPEIAQLPPDGGAEFNRLIHETSPYLLQHARNPVDWYPWGDEAFERARAEDKPVFLSVGYSTCHWCHVMERESFEQPRVAAVLNETCVAIKVDREERPDLDEIYMMATQSLTGHGGWPNSVWLTPDGRPWYAGTYFPPEDRGGRLGFTTMLRRLDDVWRNQRARVEESANQLADRLRDLSAGRLARPGGRLDRGVVRRAIDELEAQFDAEGGGFGGAPKFPPHGSLQLLLAEIDAGRDDNGRLQEMLVVTLNAMARGGIHDQLAGGFHRYSTDAEWLVPHFEKMLYDNAQLGFVYGEAYRLLGQREFERTARSLFDWVLAEMQAPEGGFYSALDADSEGVEGKCYVWSRAEIEHLLADSPEDTSLFCDVYGVTDEGNYLDEATHVRTGDNILHRPRTLDEVCRARALSVTEGEERVERSGRRLLAARRERTQPFLDDKILTAWNGLMIGAFAHAARVFDEPRYEVAARRCADFLLEHVYVGGRLKATVRLGEARLAGYLDDHAFLASGLVDLYELTHDGRYLNAAIEIARELSARFQNRSDGGFFFTADDHEELLVRSQDPFDKAIPSGNGVAARLFLRLGVITGDSTYRDVAERVLSRFLPQMRAAPRGTETLILATNDFLRWQERTQTAEAKRALVGSADVEARQGEWVARLFLGSLAASPGSGVPLCVVLETPSRWSGQGSQENSAATVSVDLELHEAEGFALAPATADPVAGSPAPVGQEVVLQRRLTVGKGVARGAHGLRFRLRVEVCTDDRCEVPTMLDLDVPFLVSDEPPNSALRHAQRLSP